MMIVYCTGQQNLSAGMTIKAGYDEDVTAHMLEAVRSGWTGSRQMHDYTLTKSLSLN